MLHEATVLEVTRINRWTDSTARSTVKASLRGAAAARAYHLKPSEFLILDDFLTALRTLFVPRSANQLARADLDIIQQKPGEDISTFHARTRLCYILAYPGVEVETSEVCIRTFIKGLESATLKDYCLLKDPKQYSLALQLAQEKSGVERLVSHFQFGSSQPLTQLPSTGGVPVPEAAAPTGAGPTPMELGAIQNGKESHQATGGPKKESSKSKFDPCPVCSKTNHPVQRCFMLRRMKKLYEANKDKETASKN